MAVTPAITRTMRLPEEGRFAAIASCCKREIVYMAQIEVGVVLLRERFPAALAPQG